VSHRRIRTPPFGFLAVDKPSGPTSHDIVADARRSLRIRKVGHAGTLDPFATGLLLLAVGAATRLMEYLGPLEKEYVATARLGETTETLDPEGESAFVSDGWKRMDRAQIEAALKSFEGQMDQLPPVYSAKKLGGESAHRRARRGEPVELRPSSVTIHEVELLALSLPEVTFRLRCSTGTYVRSVARDLGERLGVGAYLTALRRTAIGPVRVEDALDPTDLDDPEKVAEGLMSPRQALRHLPELEVGESEFQRLGHGQSIALDDLRSELNPVSPKTMAPGPLVVHSPGWTNRVVIAEWQTSGRVHPLPPPQPSVREEATAAREDGVDAQKDGVDPQEDGVDPQEDGVDALEATDPCGETGALEASGVSVSLRPLKVVGDD
jgi:tRNA pseudouridine55 synthase